MRFAIPGLMALALGACTQEQTEQAAHPGQTTDGTAAAAEKLDQAKGAQPGARSDEPLAPNAGVGDPTPGQSNTSRPPS